MSDQWKIPNQIFLWRRVWTEEGEAFSIRAQDFSTRNCLEGSMNRARSQGKSRMCRWSKASTARLSYLRVFLSCQKLNLFFFFNLLKPQFRTFPAESKFVSVKSFTQNLCFYNAVLKNGARIGAVKFCSKYLISSLSCRNFLFNCIVLGLCLKD